MKTRPKKPLQSAGIGPLVTLASLLALAIAVVRRYRRGARSPQVKAKLADKSHYDVVVIGSGFGGSLAGLTVARAMQARERGEKMLMLERGTWWTTPVNTVEDKEGATARFLSQQNQPVQFWNSIDHFSGLFDLVKRCLRRPGNEDGLYAQTEFGRRGPIGLAENDGVSIIGASGVGGGSLVYSNVTLAPPDFIFDDPAWPVKWNGQRQFWFDLARVAIGSGVLHAWARQEGAIPDQELRKLRTGTGLSNLATRSPRLDPHWPRDAAGKPVKRIDLNPNKPADAPDPANALWIDRARVFQTAISQITADYGTAESAINDLPSEPEPFNPEGRPVNYCERQGRCILGCLPDARQTLSKQLMAAIFGAPALHGQPARPPLLPCMSLQTLAEVDEIRAKPEGGYEVHFSQRDPQHLDLVRRKMVTTGVVILAAGCTNTNEIMLRSKASGGLPHLSSKLGYGFSTNGDSLQFLDKTRERTYLTRGPMMTSYGRFHTPSAGDSVDPSRYHALEDNGIPKVFAMLVGVGQPILRSLAKGQGRRPDYFMTRTTSLWVLGKVIPQGVRAFLPGASQRQKSYRSEEETLSNMLVVATMGRDQANGQFRLGDPAAGETPLRLSRTDGKEFYQDPIYQEIQDTLAKFAEILTGRKGARFQNPFFDLGRGKGSLLAPVPLTHPLGGCRMATSAGEGVVDEFGRVYDTSREGEAGYYQGLYITDAAIIPTSLGINPTLTIAALALRAGDQIVKDWFAGSD